MNEIEILKINAKKNLKCILFTEHNIKLSDNAVKKIQSFRAEKPNQLIRVIVDGGGCQGFQYKFTNDQLANIAQNSKDIVLIDGDNCALLVFDLFSEFYITGSTIDYDNNLIQSGFKINNNPKAQSSCGCKKSFAVGEFYEGEE